MVEYISKSDICLLCINKHNEIESTEKKVNWVGKKLSACKIHDFAHNYYKKNYVPSRQLSP